MLFLNSLEIVFKLLLLPTSILIGIITTEIGRELGESWLKKYLRGYAVSRVRENHCSCGRCDYNDNDDNDDGDDGNGSSVGGACIMSVFIFPAFAPFHLLSIFSTLGVLLFALFRLLMPRN